MDLDEEVYNITHSLGQPSFHQSVSEDHLWSYEKQLSSRFDGGTRKLELTYLYSRLLMEWIDTTTTAASEIDSLEKSDGNEFIKA